MPSILAISFSTLPSISPSSNITTVDSFFCEFTPTTGVISANITWYRNSILWSGDDQNTSVANDVLFQSVVVDTTNTARSQTWQCQVTLNNATNSLSANSSSLTLVNALPIIEPTLNQTAYEDSPFSLQMNANDPDGDSFSWLSIDQNSSYYGTSLFSISPSGLISFTQTNESLVGNHSFIILANDFIDLSAKKVNFELIAVNDAPQFTVLSTNCFEGSLCNYQIITTDEENDVLSFTANNSLINLSSSGLIEFMPVFTDLGSHLILINASDGVNWTTAEFNITINATNNPPVFSEDSLLLSSGVQNQSGNFTFFVNATDSDLMDTISFSIESSSLSSYCSSFSGWSIIRLSDGSSSTNATAMINLNISNNNFVACRGVTINITDGKNSTSKNFSLDINNSNDPPRIFNESYFSENVVSTQFTNTNMSNVTLAKGLPFSFRVNASDIDNLTYEGEVLLYSLLGHNASLYQINSSSGLITSLATLMNDSYIGNVSFFVNVSDDEGLFVLNAINITIINNSLPVVSSLNDSNCLEDDLCHKIFSAYDAEGNNLTLTLGLNYTSPLNFTTTYDSLDTFSLLNVSFNSYNGSQTNFSSWLYPSDSRVGNYTLNITFTDDFGASTKKQINFSIMNIEDIPFLGDNSSSLRSDNLTFPVAAENFSFSKILYGIDGDTFYNQDNLSFNYSFLLGSLTPSLLKLNRSAALLEFNFTLSDAGNYSINLTVIDQSNNYSSKVVNFTVYDSSQSPLITSIKPYVNASNSTVLVFGTPDPSGISLVSTQENTSIVFDIQATDADNLDMVLRWYEDGILQTGDLPLSGSSSFLESYNYSSSGLMNITVEVVDKGLTSYTWLVTIADLNQVPLFLHNISDLSATTNNSITGTQVFADFFRTNSPDNIVFLDPDDDENNNSYLNGAENNTLIFSYDNTTSCNSFATFVFDNKQLTIDPSIIGNCSAKFYANDSYGVSVVSNTIRIDILDLGQSTTVTQSGSGSSRSSTVTKTLPVPVDVNVPTTVKFIYPGISSLFSDGTVVIPFTLKNTWTTTISGIDLSFNASIPELQGEISINRVESLTPNEVVHLNLTYINYRFEAPFEVNISASISSLELIDTASVFINALEKGSYSEEAVKTRVGFARDLLNDNSECQELNEILTSAENEDDSDLSLKLINSVIDGCKYLINAKKTSTGSLPKSFIGKLGVYTENYVDYRLLFTLIIGMTLLAVAIGVFSKFKLKKI